MPSKPPAPALVAGPYKTPRCKVGREFYCVINGDREVRGITDAPIPWPYAYAQANVRQLFVSGDLFRAVRTESVRAVAWHWGVSRSQVEAWRRVLRIPRMTPGTAQLWRELAPVRLGDPRKYKPDGAVPHKLDRAKVAQLRQRAAKGESAAALGVAFGITRQYASAIISNKVRRSKAE